MEMIRLYGVIKPRFPSDTIYQGDREICSINYLEATFRKIEAKG